MLRRSKISLNFKPPPAKTSTQLSSGYLPDNLKSLFWQAASMSTFMRRLFVSERIEESFYSYYKVNKTCSLVFFYMLPRGWCLPAKWLSVWSCVPDPSFSKAGLRSYVCVCVCHVHLLPSLQSPMCIEPLSVCVLAVTLHKQTTWELCSFLM